MLFCRRGVGGWTVVVGKGWKVPQERNQYVLTVRNTFEPLSRQVTRSYDRRRRVTGARAEGGEGWGFKGISILRKARLSLVVVGKK